MTPTSPSVPAEAAPAATASIRRRYAATLFTQSVQLAASVLSAGIVPRALGPAAYGNYNFLLNTAATLRGFLEPSAQQAFFTFSSQDRRSGPLTKLYGLTLMAQMAIIFAAIGLAMLAGATNWLWPEQKLDQILWVTLLDWAMLAVVLLRQLGDSKGLTVRAQALSAAAALLTIAGLLALLAAGWLNFYTFVGLNLVSALLVGAALAYYLLYANADLCWAGELRGRVRDYLHRWWRYAAPLIALEYYKPLTVYLSTYLVQRWYGSVEQGYFALASRWSALVLVFTSSALMIVWREIAHSMAAGERERAGRVFLQFNQLLFFLALVLCFWLSLGSKTLVAVLAGGEYQPAVPVLALMAFYPLQQTYGQLNTAALKASERTAQVRNLGFAVSIPDLLLTYFLLAPVTAPVPGFGLGAMGVALKMVGYGLLSVQAYEWANLRFFGASYFRMLARKLGAAAVVGLSALATLRGLAGWLQTQWHLADLLSLALASLVYFALIALLALLWPQLAGLRREDLASGLGWLRQSVSSRLGQS